MNVLWTYYFINGMREEAMGVWERYVKDCPQIMFQKVCQTARSRNSLQVSQLYKQSTVYRNMINGGFSTWMTSYRLGQQLGPKILDKVFFKFQMIGAALKLQYSPTTGYGPLIQILEQ